MIILLFSLPILLLFYNHLYRFQNFDYVAYSTGAIYLSILNLPGELRNNHENFIVIGIIPGPSEPSAEAMQHFMKPLILDLDMVSEGVDMSVAG
jgi:hypothetical protein